jgi:hypothetical protein
MSDCSSCGDRRGRPVALGFECPLCVPVPVEQMALGRARSGCHYLSRMTNVAVISHPLPV